LQRGGAELQLTARRLLGLDQVTGAAAAMRLRMLRTRAGAAPRRPVHGYHERLALECDLRS
jgi:hypothetical protein